jgi:hypothetical protein
MFENTEVGELHTQPTKKSEKSGLQAATEEIDD